MSVKEKVAPYSVGAVCCIIAVVAFSMLYSYAATHDPDYVFLDSYLSDLGVGPAAWAFNSALMLAGALMFVFSLTGLYPLLGRATTSRAGSVLMALAGALLVNVGIFTEDFGDTHYGFSIAFFLALLAAIGVIAYAMYDTDALGNLGTAVSASAFTFGVVLLALGIGPFTETLAALTALAWGAVVAVLMLLRAHGDHA